MTDSVERPICNFWTRVLAMSIDSFLLGIFGIALGFLFFDKLAAMGGWGRLIGFSISFFYF